MAQGFSIPLIQKCIWGNSPPATLASLPSRIELADGSELQAIPAPGHAEDMVCYFAPDKGWLFSADLYISRSIRYMRDDENLSVLINSIRRVLPLDFDTIFCPHRGVVENGRQALAEKLSNLKALCEKTQNLHHQGQSVKAISRTLLGLEDSISCLTGFGFCKQNLIRECLKVDLLAIYPVT